MPVLQTQPVTPVSAEVGLKTTLGEGRFDTFNSGGPRGPSAGPETSFVVLPQQHPRWAQTRIADTSRLDRATVNFIGDSQADVECF
jgi:hypothetical protein